MYNRKSRATENHFPKKMVNQTYTKIRIDVIEFQKSIATKDGTF